MCGSGISADEKFKKQKNGNVHRHVYYGCTKSRDKNCKSGYINEDELISQLEGFMEKIDIDELGIKEKIKAEVERFKKFNQVVLGIKERLNVTGIDIRNYAKYILREGTIAEKRELLGCLKSAVFLKNKLIYLSNDNLSKIDNNA